MTFIKSSLVSVVLIAGCASGSPSDPNGADRSTFQKLRAQSFEPIRKGPAPHAFTDDAPPFGRSVRYRNEDGDELLAFLAEPMTPLPSRTARRGALLYVHRGFSLKQKDFALLKPYYDAGFTVFAPSFRGENGNPGHFELWRGELNDLLAAIEYLKGYGISEHEIHAFGHSAGGGLVTLLTLFESPALGTYASSNGIYAAGTIGRWAQRESEDLVRFDPNDDTERRVRVLIPNISEMKHPLIAFTGTEDVWTLRHTVTAIKSANKHGKSIEQRLVPGRHGPSQVPALAEFLRLITAEGRTPP